MSFSKININRLMQGVGSFRRFLMFLNVDLNFPWAVISFDMGIRGKSPKRVVY